MHTIHQSRDAMATRFEVWLIGEDTEHLEAVAGAALDEVQRVEQLLSRFDPRSEISRINRQADAEPILIDVEETRLLHACLDWCVKTQAYYEVAARTGGDASSRDIELDAVRRTVRLLRSDVRLDLGGIGKGYALDCIADLLREHAVTGALVHGGTSSVLAHGTDATGRGWSVGIRSPEIGGAEVRELGVVELAGESLSTSSALAAGQRESDIVDPHTGQPLERQASCTVIAPTAREAEVLSTALLGMGKHRGAEYTACLPRGVRVAWIDGHDQPLRIERLSGAR